MNGNGNQTQRIGKDFLKHLEDIMEKVEELQGVKISVRQITNLLTQHANFEAMKTDTINFKWKEIKDKWHL